MFFSLAKLTCFKAMQSMPRQLCTHTCVLKPNSISKDQSKAIRLPNIIQLSHTQPISHWSFLQEKTQSPLFVGDVHSSSWFTRPFCYPVTHILRCKVKYYWHIFKCDKRIKRKENKNTWLTLFKIRKEFPHYISSTEHEFLVLLQLPSANTSAI